MRLIVGADDTIVNITDKITRERERECVHIHTHTHAKYIDSERAGMNLLMIKLWKN